MDHQSFFENLSIYGVNLSIYYVVSVLVTILSIILAWWYTKRVDHQSEEWSQLEKEQKDFESKHSQLYTTIKKSESDEFYEEADSLDMDNEGEIISKIKLGRRSLLEEEVAASLTEEQILEEREVEKQQLEAIYQLLQNQEDKFQVSSFKELQDQLKLYRP